MNRYAGRAGWLLLFLAAGCVNLTVNVYFPAEQVRSAIEEIESDIRNTESTSTGELSIGERFFARFIPSKISFGPIKASAQRVVDLKAETPVIVSLKKQRKERFKKIDPYLEKGILGEGREGYLVIRDKSDLGLKERGALKRLVEEENEDRKKMYLEILQANNLPKKELEQVEKLAAEAIRKVLKPHRWYEVKEDKWVQKPEKKDGEEK